MILGGTHGELVVWRSCIVNFVVLVKQHCICDHFSLWGTTRYLWKDRLPTMAKWDCPQLSGIVILEILTLRENLDDLSPEEVIWDPYVESKRRTPFHSITWFQSCLICPDVEEPYHHDQVMRQMGRVQVSPSPPIQAKMKNRCRSYHNYSVKHEILSSFAATWHIYLLSIENQGAPVKFPRNCNNDYFEWFHEISHPFIRTPKTRKTHPLRNKLFISHNRNKLVDEALQLVDTSHE